MTYRICGKCMMDYQDRRRETIAFKLPWRNGWIYRTPTEDLMKEYENGKMQVGNCGQHERIAE